ncbi:YwiB family protein [Alicyclobacillus mengziensis]|uniref:DUF1934 domain-containing protein n=1 Tax=Alicyclobacillus mengziensis TaxID=2931921 RepID=A0A9X7Z7S1_9BACL|nr:DUF1934 domain-containing protein [Alicyclobacillus mengziensis]QSO47645.1 DUF1934 domain-containing protein [Alicyclobacillus mengziensis]
MDEFWLSEHDFLVPVRLDIKRRNRWLGPQKTGRTWDDEERQTVEHVRWKQSNQAHEISYQEVPPSQTVGRSADGAATANDPVSLTVCRIQPGHLTWERHGGVEWEHVFQSGETSTSIMEVPGAGSIEVRLKTRNLRIIVDKAGGTIEVAYDMTISDVTQYIELTMRFKRT